MMKTWQWWPVVVVIALLTGLALPLAAQETALPEGCDPLGALADVQALIESAPADAEVLMALVEDVAAQLAEQRAICAGLAFEGTGSRVIGPFEVPAGVYRAIVTTEGYFAALVQPMAGECGPRSSSGRLFNLGQGDAADGAEALLMSEGCLALVETSNVTAPWTLTFEEIQ